MASPAESRAADETFVLGCSLSSLKAHLPLLWPTPAETPASPKGKYRSHYRHLGFDELFERGWEGEFSAFELLLRLVDFEGLRAVLGQRLGWQSALGKVPFDPISLFLLQGWQTTNGWSRAETLRQLKKSRNADYAQRFGFVKGDFPTEGGLRHFLTALGNHSTQADRSIELERTEEETITVALEALNDLISQSITLIRAAGLLSPEAWDKALLCPDGMLHDAASSMRCAFVRESCYQPTTASQPRPCPAQQKDKKGCACDTVACSSICRSATPRDPQARMIYYRGRNGPSDSPNQAIKPDQAQKGRGQIRFGYRSLPLQLSDPQRRFSLVLADHFLPANEREEVPATALLYSLPQTYPDLGLEAVAGDAGFGYDLPLTAIYDLGAKRLVDLRAHQTDKDQALWPLRGYDDQGRPICQFGYPFTANGFDPKKQRHKWCCKQACSHGAEPVVTLDLVSYPPQDCPYRDPDHPHGQVINVAKTFSDGSIRLVRDIPVGTPAWKRFYHRARNAVEGRNSAFQAWGLKRLPVFGAPRAKATIFLADVWLNLTTLARLVREASLAPLPA